MKLSQLLDKDLLMQHIAERLVGVQRHPALPLRILNYTHSAQYDPHWGDGTIDYCRGLIVDDDDNIVARPFKKFHNFQTQSIPETLEENLPKTTPTITIKFDGSLGILYQYNGDYGVATRGSFMSPQAQWATKWIKDRIEKRVEHYPLSLPTNLGYTALFEIIYDANRIVVKYPYEGLILLGLVNIDNGSEATYETISRIARRCGFLHTEKLDTTNIHDVLLDNKENEEGYVITYDLGYQSPLKLKIKMADYVRLHKIIAGLNARSIWEHLKSDTFLRLSDLPKHIQTWYDSWVFKLQGDFINISKRATDLYLNRPFREPGMDEKQYRAVCAAYFFRQKQDDLKAPFFLMLDGKSASEAVWGMIEPRGDDRSFQVAQGEE